MIPSKRETMLAYAVAYRDLLGELNALYREGGSARVKAVGAFNIHREQLANVIEVISPYIEQDKDVAAVAAALPRVGGAVINFCLHWDERIRWSSLAMTAAEFLNDRARVAQNANDLGAACISNGGFARAGELLEFALSEAIALGDLDAEAAARGNLANLRIRTENPADAIPHLRRAAEIYQQNNDRRLPDALNSLSVALINVGERDEALRVAQRSYEAAGDNRRAQARAMSTWGICLRRQRREREAEEAYNIALQLFRDADDVVGEADVLANLSLLFEILDPPRAEQFATDALELRVQHDLGNTKKLIARLQRFRRARQE